MDPDLFSDSARFSIKSELNSDPYSIHHRNRPASLAWKSSKLLFSFSDHGFLLWLPVSFSKLVGHSVICFFDGFIIFGRLFCNGFVTIVCLFFNEFITINRLLFYWVWGYLKTSFSINRFHIILMSILLQAKKHFVSFGVCSLYNKVTYMLKVHLATREKDTT